MSSQYDNFDAIRSFHDSEVNDALRKLTDDKHFLQILKKVFGKSDISDIIADLRSITSIHEFQSKYISGFAKNIIKNTINKLTFSGIEQIEKGKGYLFLSSHRDIVLDSALLNEVLHSNGLQTSEIAIGGNLLIFPWIEILVKLNRSFIVRRDLQGKEMLLASKQLSQYIRKKITEDNTSIWIAQREGRTKDGNDRTQSALLKMFNMGGDNDFETNFRELNIIPLTISYEYETCIPYKINEVYARRQNIKFIKTKEDDLKSMGEGLFGKKGNVHIDFGKQLNEELTALQDIKKTNERFETLAKIIDNAIHKTFKVHSGNYIGHDLFFGKDDYFRQGKYTKEELEKFRDAAQHKISGIDGRESDLLQVFYEIYAMPLENQNRLNP